MEEIKIKNCPFCNGKSNLIETKGFHGELIMAFVRCEKCGASSATFSTVEGTIGAWNMRNGCKETEKYISKVLTRLTVVGALFLVVLAALPIACRLIPNMPANVSIGGTGLLIVVGVALETYKQIENIVVSRNYSRSYK